MEWNGSWLFSEENLLKNTPSRLSGISYDDELQQRSMGVSLIRECGISLQLLVHHCRPNSNGK